MAIRLDLLSDASASGDAKHWPGGDAQFAVVGTFDGATVQLSVLGPDGTTWLPVGDYTTMTAAGVANCVLPNGCQVKAEVSGGTSPSGLYASLVSIGDDGN